MRIAQVALDLPRLAPFDFLVPSALADEAQVGSVVVVPLGRRKAAGIIVGFSEASTVPADKLRPIEFVQTAWPRLSAEELVLYRFCAGYYHHSLGAVILNALPPKLRGTVRFAPAASRRFTLTAAGRELHANPGRAVALQRLLADVDAGIGDEVELKSRHPAAAKKIATLLAQDALALVPPAGKSPAHRDAGLLEPGPALNGAQREALAALQGAPPGYAAFLLDGITGSGKTEVYLHAISRALAAGGQALVLLPEINLTPQFLRHLARRLPHARIAALHSALSAGERVARHLAIARDEVDIVIGTRLAVFAPLPRLALIVVDEEHDASFKQQEGLRYSARDLAVFRARHAGCHVLLGSATPSLETLANAARGRFRRLVLAERANPAALLPKVEFIDLDRERVQDGLSARLMAELEATLSRGEQALLFINRRGFAPALVCTQCGHMPACTRCSARLVFHRGESRLKCHHCGHREKVPEACAACGSIVVVAIGEGTERVEAALRRRLPAARIERVDRDSVRNKGALERVLERAARGDIDVLIGTQMLAKGHDFAGLTLVGVINADGAMFAADFRATERLVSTLTQVAGRAGRAERPGRVLIQTRFAAHPFYRAIARHDYAGFAALALEERRAAHLPPFTFLALLRAESQRLAPVEAFMEAAASAAREILAAGEVAKDEATLDIWDPVAPTLSRKAGFERRQLMVQSSSRSALQAFLDRWLPRLEAAPAQGVRWLVDVDPLDI